jgi:hypothetical protein
MNELCLWRWRFTDEFGKRRRNLLAHYKDAVKVEGSNPDGARAIRAG